MRDVDQDSKTGSEVLQQQGAVEHETQDAVRPPMQQEQADAEGSGMLKAAVRRMQQIAGQERTNSSPNLQNAWTKVQQAAARLGRGCAKNNCALILQCEHWLEAADPKHRYGTNLRPYFGVYLDERVCSESSRPSSSQSQREEQPPATHDSPTPSQPAEQAARGAASAFSPRRAHCWRRTVSAPHLPDVVDAFDRDTSSSAPQPHAPDGAPAPAAPLPAELLSHRNAREGGQIGFFQWLDEGAGLSLDLAQEGVPRCKLERERVAYLSEEEREAYEVVVRQTDRLLVYKVSGRVVDTNAAAPSGLLHVPSAPAALPAEALGGVEEAVTKPWEQQHRGAQEGQSKQQDSQFQQEQHVLEQDGELQGEARHQQDGQQHREQRQHAQLPQRRQQDVHDPQNELQRQQQQQQDERQEQEQQRGDGASTAAGGDPGAAAGLHAAATAPAVLEPKQLKKAKKSTAPGVLESKKSKEGPKPHKWIYVLDTLGRLYVHAKFKGKFHHSSFLQGGAVLAAGGIVVDAGTITKLTADSGHYRPDEDAFMAMVEVLTSMGADLSGAELTAKHFAVAGT